MVDGSFREYFHAIRAFGEQTMPYDEYEILWMEYYDSVKPELANMVKSIPNARIMNLNRKDEYHSSYCFNHGIMAAQGELIVIPDADVVVEHEFLERLLTLHAEDEKLVMYNYRFNEMKTDHVEPVTLEHLRKVCVLTHPSNWGGCVATRKWWFMHVNGYERHPIFATGDHGNDFDMFTRFKALGLHVCWSPDPMLRIYHAWHPRTLVYAYSHKLQAIVTRHRAKTLMFMAYNGIDPQYDSPMPDSIVTKIEHACKKFEAERPKQESPPELIA